MKKLQKENDRLETVNFNLKTVSDNWRISGSCKEPLISGNFGRLCWKSGQESNYKGDRSAKTKMCKLSGYPVSNQGHNKKRVGPPNLGWTHLGRQARESWAPKLSQGFLFIRSSPFSPCKLFSNPTESNLRTVQMDNYKLKSGKKSPTRNFRIWLIYIS